LTSPNKRERVKSLGKGTTLSQKIGDTMKLDLDGKDIQAIIDALQKDASSQAIATRKKIIEELKKSPAYAVVM
jgi:hypothetical protein